MIFFFLFLFFLLIPTLHDSWWGMIPLLFFLVVILKKRKKKDKKIIVFLLLFSSYLGISTWPREVDSVRKEVGIVTLAKQNYYFFQTMRGQYYIYEKDNQKVEGDLLSLYGAVKPLSFEILESQFDFQKFLTKKGCTGQMYVYHEQYIVHSLFPRKKILSCYQEKMSSSSFSFFKRFFFQESSSWGEEIENLHFYTLLALPAASISRLRVWIEKKRRRKGKKRAHLYSYLFLIPLFIMQPHRLFWKRWMIQYGIDFYAKKQNKTWSRIQKLSILGIILLFLQPFSIYQMDFCLSFSILFLHVFLTYGVYEKKRKRRGITFLYIQFILFFFEAKEKNEMNLALPFFSLLSPVQIFFSILFLCVLPFPFLIEKLFFIYQKWLQFLAPLSWNIPMGKMSSLFIGICIFFLFCSIYAYQKRWKKKWWISWGVLSSCLCFQMMPYIGVFDSVHFINVGQGDAILIRSEQKNMLIDTGGLSYFDIAEEVLLPYFRKQKVKKIDYFIPTHQDFDHIGGFETLQKKGMVRRVLEKEKDFPIKIGNLKIQNLNRWRQQFQNENNRSFVLYFSFDSLSFLLMGDAEKEVEEKMISAYPQLHTDILKVGHHGSNTSTTFPFLQHIHAKTAILSYGKNNRYGHPHEEVINRLQRLHLEIRSTAKEGTIVYHSKNHFSLFMKEIALWYTKKERRNAHVIFTLWSTGNHAK